MSNPYGRPKHHPDFDVISEAIVQGDALSESGAMSVRELLAEAGDPDTLTYFAMRRGEMVASRISNDKRLAAAAGSAWIDGLLAGYKLRQAHEKREEEKE